MRKISFIEWVAVVVALLVAGFIFAPSIFNFSGFGLGGKISSEILPENANKAVLGTDNTNQMPNISSVSGLEIYELEKASIEGNGLLAGPGKTVTVHYVGAFTDGTVFDTSLNREAPFSFTLGAGAVIRGWDEGLVGMRVGDIRRLVISPELAYGPNAVGPIPANSTLIFEVQMLEIK